ncbi:MAG TPA: ABC transporter permease [Candidatus Angelobacter sp.]|nr:ABC transporter permease [Candidatus Angelobacter sp.]
MSTSANTVSEVQRAQASPGVVVRPYLWSVQRELWEVRSVYLVPLSSAAIFLASFLIYTGNHMHSAWPTDPEKQHQMFAMPYDFAAALIMGTAFIVGIFYSIEALYGERRDRSILFWKSMPVSDVTTVLAKVTIPLVVLPLLSFVITLVTQWIMLLLSSLLLMGSGMSVSAMWTHASLFHGSLGMFYHIVTVHGLWYAPFYGWLLFISACAPRAPLIWAFLPPFVIFGVEKLAFNTTHFLALLQNRLIGPTTPAPHGAPMMQVMASLGPLEFLALPGLWIGLAIAAAFLAADVQLRRYRGPN